MANENPVIFRNRRKQYLVGMLHVPREINAPPVLLMAHGFTDDKVSDNQLFVRFARRARQEGYAVLLFDFAGSGYSEGEFADMTVTKEIQDLECAIEFAHSLPLLEESPIYLVGYSLGGAVAFSAAARDHRVRGVVGWAPVSDLRAVFSTILGEEAFLAAQRDRLVACRNDSKYFFLKPHFFLDLNHHDPARDIAMLSPRPVLIIQGTADAKVMPEQTHALFKTAGEPTALHVIEGAPHSFGFYEEDLFEMTLRHLEAWSRGIWYAVDGQECRVPSGHLHRFETLEKT